MDRRQELREKLKVEISKLTESKVQMTNEEKGRLYIEIYLKIEEDITDYLDTAFGISHHVAIGLD